MRIFESVSKEYGRHDTEHGALDGAVETVSSVVEEEGFAVSCDENRSYYSVTKEVAVGDNVYVVTLKHTPDNEKGVMRLDFTLKDALSNPITNAGLSVFGKLVDEMESMFIFSRKRFGVSRLRIYASPDNHSKDSEMRLREAVTENKSMLQGFSYISESLRRVFTVEDSILRMEDEKKNKKEVELSANLASDIQFVFQVPPGIVIQKMIEYLDGGVDDHDKKMIQRLQLYYFYLKKRHPYYIYNVLEKMEEGRRTFEFEKDDAGIPFIEAIHTDRVQPRDRTFSSGR